MGAPPSARGPGRAHLEGGEGRGTQGRAALCLAPAKPGSSHVGVVGACLLAPLGRASQGAFPALPARERPRKGPMACQVDALPGLSHAADEAEHTTEACERLGAASGMAALHVDSKQVSLTLSMA